MRTADNAYQLFISKLSEEAIELSKQQLEQARASYNAIKIQIEIANQQLKYADVRSPIDGVVVLKDIFEGALVSNTMAPYVISGNDTLQIAISVTEQVINKIRKGNELKIIIPSAKTSFFTGKITSVSPIMDDKTFSYVVLIDVPNKNNLIKPGMTAKVDILIEKRENIVIAPLNSVLSEDSGKYVFTVEDNKAVKRFVDTGISNNDFVEITKGLETGDFIIVKGQHFLKHNDPVIVSQEDL